MDTKEIISAIAQNNLDLGRERIHQALSEKAVEALQTRKVEIGRTYFDKE